MREKTHGTKRFVHPQVGELTLHYETFAVAGSSGAVAVSVMTGSTFEIGVEALGDVDVLLEQHGQMRQLCTAVDKAEGADKARLLAQLGIAQGTSAGKFQPTAPTTRGQMAFFLSRDLSVLVAPAGLGVINAVRLSAPTAPTSATSSA